MKLRYAVLIGMGVFLSFWVYLYMASDYYSAVQLRVRVACVGNSTQSTVCDGISVQDSDLEQSPKLKEALVKSTLAPPDTGGKIVSSVEMTPSEFDSMNRMIVNAVPDAAKSYNPDNWQDPNPTKALWPTGSTFVLVAYSGNAYSLQASYFGPKPLTPRVWDWYP